MWLLVLWHPLISSILSQTQRIKKSTSHRKIQKLWKFPLPNIFKRNIFPISVPAVHREYNCILDNCSADLSKVWNTSLMQFSLHLKEFSECIKSFAERGQDKALLQNSQGTWVNIISLHLFCLIKLCMFKYFAVNLKFYLFAWSISDSCNS